MKGKRAMCVCVCVCVRARARARVRVCLRGIDARRGEEMLVSTNDTVR